MRRAFFLLVPLLLAAGCTREEEPVAERYERQKAEIENKARAYEAEVENEVAAYEARLENETAAWLEAVAGNASASDTANGAAANRQ